LKKPFVLFSLSSSSLSSCHISLVMMFLLAILGCTHTDSYKFQQKNFHYYLENRSEKFVYHGSPECFETVKAHHSTRRSREGKKEWEGTAIFATQDIRIALQYTGKSKPAKGYSSGVGLLNKITRMDTVYYHISGGESKSEAFKALYGTNACIYVFNKSNFHWENGLGIMEVIHYGDLVPVERIEFDPSKLIPELEQKNQIHVIHYASP